MPTKHSDEILKAALVGFEQQRAELAARISELKQMLAGGAKLPAAKGAAKEDAVPKKKRRRLSAAGRKAISEAAKRRWASSRASAGTSKRAAKKA